MTKNMKLGPGMALASLAKLFSPTELDELYTGKRVGTIDIEITDLCNFKCGYCYASCSPTGNEFTKDKPRLTMDEIKSVLNQAADMDIRLFNIQGGEPMLDKAKFFEIAEYARPKFKSLVAFTNGSRIGKEEAKKIKELDMSLCVKLDTLDNKIWDKLTQNKGSFNPVMSALGFLQHYGVVVSTNSVATPLNYYDIPNVWRFVTMAGWTPFVARNHYHGRTRENTDLQLTAQELGNLFNELKRIDRDEFNIEWPADIIWPRGNSCQRYRAGVFVNHIGDVLPCSEADPKYFKLGNVREKPLKEILSFENLRPIRSIYDSLHGACATSNCEYSKNQQCYGCRVSAADVGVLRGYNFIEQFYGGDPLCKHNHINPLTAKELGRAPLKAFDSPSKTKRG